MKYFLHDTSAFDDEKISELFINFGYEGLGLFYTTLEKIGKQEKPIKTDVLKSQLRVGKRLEKCWNFMEQIGLIFSSNGESFNNQLLNFSETYQIKKEKTREKVSEWRKKQLDTKNVTSYVPVSNPPKVKESKVKESKVSNILTWKESFEVYKQSLDNSYLQILDDLEFIKSKEEFYPNVDIKLSIKKSYVEFWSLMAGWKNKKASKSKDLDWYKTFTNAINLNKVYKPKQYGKEIEYLTPQIPQY